MKQRAIIATLIAPLLVLACLPAVAYAEPACTPDNGVTVADTFLGSYSCNGVTAYNLDFDAGEDNTYRLQAHSGAVVATERVENASLLSTDITHLATLVDTYEHADDTLTQAALGAIVAANIGDGNNRFHLISEVNNNPELASKARQLLSTPSQDNFQVSSGSHSGLPDTPITNLDAQHGGTLTLLEGGTFPDGSTTWNITSPDSPPVQRASQTNRLAWRVSQTRTVPVTIQYLQSAPRGTDCPDVPVYGMVSDVVEDQVTRQAGDDVTWRADDVTIAPVFPDIDMDGPGGGGGTQPNKPRQTTYVTATVVDGQPVEAEGITWNTTPSTVTVPGLGDIQEVTYTATSQPGYALTNNTQTVWRFRITPPIDCTPEPVDIHNTTQPVPPLGHLPNTGATIQAWAPVGVAVLAIIGAVAALTRGRMNLKKTD